MSFSITKNAVGKILALKNQSQDDHELFRIQVSGSNLTGFQYDFAFTSKSKFNDVRFTFEGIEVLLDYFSYQCLVNSSLDYIERDDHFEIINSKEINDGVPI